MFDPFGVVGEGYFFYPQVIFCISLRSYKKITQRLSTLNLFEVPFVYCKNSLLPTPCSLFLIYKSANSD